MKRTHPKVESKKDEAVFFPRGLLIFSGAILGLIVVLSIAVYALRG